MPTQPEIQKYIERSGDECFQWDLPLHEFMGGWFNYTVDDRKRALAVVQAYGNHKALLSEARKVAKRYGCQQIVFGTRHRAEAMARLFKGRVLGYAIGVPVDG